MSTDRLTASTPDVAILGIHGPADLSRPCPYLLGFHPKSSLVLVGLRESRLVVTARLDLVDVNVPGVLSDAVAAMHRGGAAQLVAAVYADRPAVAARRPVPWRSAAGALTDEAGRAGCEVLDVLLVARRALVVVLVHRSRLLSARGAPLPDEVSEFCAAATYAGLVALPDRDALAAILHPLPDDDREAAQPH